MKHVLPILMAVVLVGIVAAFFGWAFMASGGLGGGWENLLPIWRYVVGGLVVVGALTGVLMWLAFYSSRRGYDEPHDVNKPRRGRTR